MTAQTAAREAVDARPAHCAAVAEPHASFTTDQTGLRAGGRHFLTAATRRHLAGLLLAREL